MMTLDFHFFIAGNFCIISYLFSSFFVSVFFFNLIFLSHPYKISIVSDDFVSLDFYFRYNASTITFDFILMYLFHS